MSGDQKYRKVYQMSPLDYCSIIIVYNTITLDDVIDLF